MIDVVVVRLKATKGIYYVSPNMLELKIGDLVVFETDNGLQLGEVCKDIYKEKQDNVDLPLQKVVRIAEDSDIKNFEDNVKITDKALKDARKISKDLELDMNFVEAYYSLDKSQLVFSFLSENRVDFRELAKKLAQKYKTGNINRQNTAEIHGNGGNKNGTGIQQRTNKQQHPQETHDSHEHRLSGKAPLPEQETCQHSACTVGHHLPGRIGALA